MVKQKIDHLDAKLERASVSVDLSEVAAHMIALTGSLGDLKTSPLSVTLAARSLQWYHEAATLCDTAAIIEYLSAYRKKYPGRGLPVTFDPRLGQMAQSKVISALHTGKPAVGAYALTNRSLTASQRSSDFDTSSTLSIGPSVHGRRPQHRQPR